MLASNVSSVVYERTGIEARGFIFAPSVALQIGAKFIPLRKSNRLPGRGKFSLDKLLVSFQVWPKIQR
jgi:hypothetical protein